MPAAATRPARSPRIVAWGRMGDESLASRAAAGNEAAFTALYKRYHGPLLGYCRSILLDAEDASDATQSALENALRALPRREPGRPLRPWLYRIAHNEAINIVRRRAPVADGGLDSESLLTVPGPDVDAEQRARLAQLVDDLRALPERQRGALVMRELSGLGYDEIGHALGVSQEAARRAVCDARSALHAAVDGRATECTSVRRCLSDGDRRRLRARGVRAHLRSCDDCASFERTIGVRQADLLALGPWIGATSLLGLIGFGGGTAKGAALVAGSGGGAVAASGGGLGWGALPAAVKGVAVAAVVATTGTAAVELPKVANPGVPAPRERAAAPAGASAPAAVSQTHELLRERALAQAAAARRAGARSATARGSTAARVRTSTGRASSATLDSGAAHARPAAPAPPATAPVPPPAVATAPSPPARPAPTAVRTREQVAAERLERIRAQIMAAYADAQRIAGSGTAGALAAADALIQDALASVRPLLDRVVATVGLRLPPSATATPKASDTTVSNVLAPAQSLLSGVNATLRSLFARR